MSFFENKPICVCCNQRIKENEMEVIEKGIAHKFAAKEKLIAPNVDAFRMGLEIGKQQKAGE